MPDPSRSRRRYYYSTPEVGNDEHPFLTAKGYQLQRQQAQIGGSAPRPLPEYSVPGPSVDVQRSIQADSSIDLQNFLTSPKYPDPRVLEMQPLTSRCTAPSRFSRIR